MKILGTDENQYQCNVFYIYRNMMCMYYITLRDKTNF